MAQPIQTPPHPFRPLELHRANTAVAQKMLAYLEPNGGHWSLEVPRMCVIGSLFPLPIKTQSQPWSRTAVTLLLALGTSSN